MDKNDLKESFLGVLEKNLGTIVKISRAYTCTKQDREDLINDIVFQLWKSFSNFRGDSKISTWIYRVALNVSMNYKREIKNNPLRCSINEMNEKDIFNWLYVEQDSSSEIELLYNCIDELNEINKVIILLYLDGNSHEDISEIMNISKTNVATRISRIKEQLKNIVNSKNV